MNAAIDAIKRHRSLVIPSRECVEQLAPTDSHLYGELDAITGGHWREAAERLGMPESTLRTRWKRVLARLKACLERKSRT